MFVKLLRWLGVATLPFVCVMLTQFVVVMAVFYVLKIAFGGEASAMYCAHAISAIPGGAMIPLVAGCLAPTGKKVAALVMCCVCSIFILLSALLAFGQGMIFVVAVNLVMMATCIAMTVYIYNAIASRPVPRYNAGEEVIDVEPESSIGEKLKNGATAVASGALILLILALKLAFWFLGFAFFAFLSRWGYSLIGTGVLRTIGGIVLMAVATPSVIGNVFHIVTLCLTSVPMACVAIFGDE